ncbi:MAG: serine/threonine-protein kinase [Acidobacteriota bacterium]
MHDPRRYGTLVPHGEGGMATVYQGHDAQLGRHVALKFLHRDDPFLQRRLLREARLQARLHHPGICRVYDVGTSPDGRAYIAMEWIDGEELDAVALHLPLTMRIDLIRQTALAVSAAHAAGLLHRDLKPSNILVRRPPADASQHPASDVAVVDFGLVWTAEREPLTQLGTMLGTPAYAPPELLRGTRARWGPPVDVYSLGATLFHVLAGRPPFEGRELVHVMRAVLRDPAPDVREFAPETPRALASVVARCLEKAPALRYPTMAALAVELTKVQQSLAASPRTRPRPARRAARAADRALRRLRDTPWLAAIVLSTLALTITLAVQLRQQEAQRASLRHYDAQAGTWESALRAARFGQPGALIAAKARVRAQMTALEAPADDARRALHAAALGRGHLALGEFAHAVTQLAQAWDDGARAPSIALAYAVALGERYGDRLDEIAASGRSHRDEITRLLRWVDARDAELSARAERPVGDYVAALLAYYDQRYDEAHRRAARMAVRHPWFYEAHLLAADALRRRANQEEERGNLAAMRASHEAAYAAFVEVGKVAHGAPEPWLGQCAMRRRQLYTAYEYGAARSSSISLEQLDRWRDAARTACRTALRHDPESVFAYVNEAHAVLDWGRAVYDFDLHDPRPAMRDAIVRLDAALLRHPRAVRLYAARADLRWLIGVYAMLIEQADPRAFYQHAARDYRRALAVEPARAIYRFLLAQAYTKQLDYEVPHGLSAAVARDHALRELVRAEQILQARPSPELPRAWIDIERASIHRMTAFGQYLQGRDFGAHAARFFEACHRALQQGGASGRRLACVGRAYSLRGYHNSLHGRDVDAASDYRQAIAYQTRVSRQAGSAIAMGWLMNAYLDAIRHDLVRGVDPRDLLSQAERHLADVESLVQDDSTYARGQVAEMRLELAIEQIRRRFVGFRGDDLRDAAAEADALAWFQRPDYAGEPYEDVTTYLLWRAWDAHVRGAPAAAARLLDEAARMQQRMQARGGNPQMVPLYGGAMAVLRAQMARDPQMRAIHLAEAEAAWRTAFTDNRWLAYRIPLWIRMADALRDADASGLRIEQAG